jgi:hypothetical protein
MSSRKPPPIPRKTETVPANIQRAREQIANERNRARANAMVEKARQNRERRRVLTSGQQQSVETAFQQRNEMDAIIADQLRQNARREMSDFQNRTGRILSSEVERRRKIPTQAQELTRELFLTALAKRSNLGRGLPDSGSEAEVKQYLVNKFGSEAGAEAQVSYFHRQLGGLPMPKKPPPSNLLNLIGTTVRPTPALPQPQPEPEPEPER